MKYFFALGNHPDISSAELGAILRFQNVILKNNILIADTDELNPVELIRRLGGTIKIGKVFAEVNDRNKLLEVILKKLNPSTDGKYKFGLSYYGDRKFNEKPIGMEIKKFFKDQGISCRWVISKEKVLSSVVVEQNKLVGKGDEIVIIEDGNKLHIGRTLAVQPFKELSFRDYGRPGRDDASGMLPPKLAQILINLTGVDYKKTILDPFCGSGTIITEAALMGYEKITGSDISEKAVKDTLKNIEWIREKYKVSNKIRVFNLSATELSKGIKTNSIDAIATEPYLGPQKGLGDIIKTKKDLDKLYSSALQEWRKIIKSGGNIVMIWPILNTGKQQESIRPRIDGYEIINDKLIYKREGQRVWRRLVILKKN